jgi:hypothetical protein
MLSAVQVYLLDWSHTTDPDKRLRDIVAICPFLRTFALPAWIDDEISPVRAKERITFTISVLVGSAQRALSPINQSLAFASPSAEWVLVAPTRLRLRPLVPPGR